MCRSGKISRSALTSAGRKGVSSAVRRLPGDQGGLPAIALSAFARESDRLDALRAGYDRHLAKPIEPHLLRSAIVELLANRPR